jgi:penicillin-binding protein 1A
MLENGFITAEEAETAKQQVLQIKTAAARHQGHSDYVTEMVRQAMFAQYGEETYTRGLDVVTTIIHADQEAAYKALRRGIMDFERRQVYRGPEKFISLPSDPQEMEDAIDEALDEHPDNGDVQSAVVISADPKKIRALRHASELVEITGEGLKPAQSGLSEKAAPNIRIRPGALIRVVKMAKGGWEITQLPEVEGAFVALDPRDGSIKALVGGFDFVKNKFNHVTQAWRQQGPVLNLLFILPP